MNIAFIDIESNGLPSNYKAHFTDVDCWPRVISFAYQIAEEKSGVVIREFHSLVKPDKWTVPVEKFWIDHGFSTEKCEAEGLPMPVVLDNFIHKLEKSGVELIVSHNLSFDYNMLAAEMTRYKKKSKLQFQKACTKELSTQLCKIPFPNRKDKRPWKQENYKWPSLSELHNFLFGKVPEQVHDALADVNTCRICFFEMKKRGHIILSPEDKTVKDVA